MTRKNSGLSQFQIFCLTWGLRYLFGFCSLMLVAAQLVWDHQWSSSLVIFFVCSSMSSINYCLIFYFSDGNKSCRLVQQCPSPYLLLSINIRLKNGLFVFRVSYHHRLLHYTSILIPNLSTQNLIISLFSMVLGIISFVRQQSNIVRDGY